VSAIQKNKSLLATGITACEGFFKKGECVAVYDNKSNLKITVGLCNYDSDALNLIKGLKSQDIKKKLGENDTPEVIHIDNMVMKTL
ncbi:MAG TPA: glutamate 5-kinase, partial [bacterium]|nr:glutamate 5-kinase [bacterium]